MKTLMWIGAVAVTVISTGCATGVKKEWQSKGYTQADIAEIHKYEDEYLKINSQGTAYSNAFNGAPSAEAHGRLRSIMCACIIKLHDKCSSNPEGLKPDERVLWAKYNAADDALRVGSTMQTPFMTAAPAIDPAECR